MWGVNRNMNVVVVYTYVVKYEKQKEFQASLKPALKQFLKYKKANPKIFEGLKSFRLFQQEYGGITGTYVEMWEFKSIEDMEKFNARTMKDKEMKKIYAPEEFNKIIDHTTLTSSIWNTVA
jgi:hypothetical protein